MKVLAIKDLLDIKSPTWRRMLQSIKSGKKVLIEDLNPLHYQLFIKNILDGARVLVLSSDQIVLKRISNNLSVWDIDNVLLPSSWSQISQGELLDISCKMNDISRSSGCLLVSFEEMFTDWPYKIDQPFDLEVGKKISFVEMSRRLVRLGYARVKKVNGRGEFSVLGDVWNINDLLSSKQNVIEFDGERIVAIRVLEKNKISDTKNIFLNPCLSSSEEIAGKVDVFAQYNFDTILWLGIDLNSEEYKNTVTKLLENVDIKTVQQIYAGCLGSTLGAKRVIWPVSSPGLLLGGQENFVKNLERLKIKKSIVLTCHGQEFRKWIDELGFSYNNYEIIEGFMPSGGIIKEDSLAIWTDRELFGIKETIDSNIEKSRKISFKKLTEFKVGDLVVHSDHGVGLLKDFITREFNDRKKDYFVVGYSKGDLLYVPVEQLNKLSKYIGSKLVKINRLGGRVWGKRKLKARKQVEEMAKELLRIYAKRKLVKRKPYLLKKNVVEGVCHDFGYELTVDQEIAWEDIQDDLSKPYPMDRLLCGDVGFGKTELALRAAGRVAAGGRQVVVLVPTTVLAEQHFVTFIERLGKYKIRVDVMSRLKDPAYQKNVLARLAKGEVDVVIGTHRLLQKDVEFKNLGLLVIDEEQKFGVRAKEQLKKMRNTVDILSMSATPIPRTLNMSMGGMRDLSVLEIAPEGRQSINTQIVPYDDEVVVEAVNREIHRGGQVFIIHNRVRTINRLKDHLQEILNNRVRIGLAHGKMSEKELADTMNKFAAGKYDVLLATTIVENGLDLPNVNTLIVENAAGLGLSQLYQLRGRVGRSSRKAYAYFLYRSEKLKDKAKQRLEAISQAKELGSGMKLAVADMEIRGVGNVLGVQQHGNAYAVGLGVFLDMLNDMVERLKGHESDDIVTDEQVVIDLPISFSVPKYYIEDKDERISWEQKLSSSLSLEDVDDLAGKLGNQHGAWPEVTENLIKIIKIRLLAGKYGIKQIFCREKTTLAGEREMNLILTFEEEVSLDWVKYLFSQAEGWIFRNNEAVIDVAKLDKKDWFDWFYNLLINKK